MMARVLKFKEDTNPLTWGGGRAHCESSRGRGEHVMCSENRTGSPAEHTRKEARRGAWKRKATENALIKQSHI